MEQNNFYSQGTNTETREPLPTYCPPSQNNGIVQENNVINNAREPLPTMNFVQQPAYANIPVQPSGTHPRVEECVDSAFGKGLAATIMSWFPICSIIAIILGSIGFSLTRKAEDLAVQYGVKASGKNIAAKILAKVGKIAGIVMTVVYALYFLIVIIAIAEA